MTTGTPLTWEWKLETGKGELEECGVLIAHNVDEAGKFHLVYAI